MPACGYSDSLLFTLSDYQFIAVSNWVSLASLFVFDNQGEILKLVYESEMDSKEFDQNLVSGGKKNYKNELLCTVPPQPILALLQPPRPEALVGLMHGDLCAIGSGIVWIN